MWTLPTLVILIACLVTVISARVQWADENQWFDTNNVTTTEGLRSDRWDATVAMLRHKLFSEYVI